MPHFLLHTTEETITSEREAEFLKAIHEEALGSGLFKEKDIKVRLERFQNSMVGGESNRPFAHVFAYIMQGRSTDQKAELSKAIVTKLNEMLPEVESIAMNVADFEAATYFNKSSLQGT